VDERDWLTSADPSGMLAFLRASGKVRKRKLRLFACACCRRVWHLLADARSRHAVELAERSADGPVSDRELDAASAAAEEAFEDSLTGERGGDDPGPAAACAASYASNPGLDAENLTVVLDGACGASSFSVAREKAAQASLLRDLFGPLPFRPVAIAPGVLTWRDAVVVRLAQAAYDARQLPAGTLEPERLAVLADALEEAGCADEAILGHLREPGAIHLRGCFVIDLLLGKG
jgi:hypothetical protein